MNELTIIAEAGVNHNGSLERALEMVDVAASAGADTIKFQTFSADSLARRDAQLADYQRASDSDTRTQWDLLKRLELTRDEFAAVRRRCDDRGIGFLSTGFDVDELRFLISELAMPRVKIASGDLTFAPLLFEAGRSGLPTILSTGMAELAEIGTALRFIGIGYAVNAGLLADDVVPTADVLDETWSRSDVQDLLRERVTILHCTTEYPAPVDSLNLRAMQTIEERFGLRVGYSDHSLGNLASTLAVGLGAQVIEKHFTLDKELDGPDHAASLDPAELHDFVERLRLVDIYLGGSEKRCQAVEVSNRAAVRRSLVAAGPIEAGSVVRETDLECRRPAGGRTAFDYWDVIGSTALRTYEAGDYVE